MKNLCPADDSHVEAVRHAIKHLKIARDFFVEAGCPASADSVRRALKSAGGALRHVRRRRGA